MLERENLVQPELQEQKGINPLIRLEFFKHDERESRVGELDINSRLTKKGRERSVSVGKTKSPHPEVAIVYGSPRERSTETALRQMLSNNTEINQSNDLEAIRNIISGNVLVGRKDLVDDRLDFNWQGEFKKVAEDHYRNKKDYLIFAVEQSDELVKKYHDMVSTSYTRQAAGVAELVKKYIDILPRWSRIIDDNPGKFDQFGNELQRFLGSHGTVIESFLLKVIEKIEGKPGLKKFINELPDKNGFNYSEGFSVNIVNGSSKDTKVEVRYKDKMWIIDVAIVEQIIKDGVELNKDISSNN